MPRCPGRGKIDNPAHRAAVAAVEAGSGNPQWIDGRDRVAILIVGGVAGDSRRWGAACAVARLCRHQALGGTGHPGGAPLVIGEVLTGPDMPLGIVDFAIRGLVYGVVERATLLVGRRVG